MKPDLMQTEEQEENLRSLAGSCPAGAIVEIGSYIGGSAVHLLRGRKNVRENPVFLLEPFKDFYSSVAEVISTYDNVLFLGCKGSSICEYWRIPIALLHEDNGHSEESTYLHLDTFGRWIVPGGYLILHDWDSPGHPGIRMAYDRWDLRHEFTEISLCGPPELQQRVLQRVG